MKKDANKTAEKQKKTDKSIKNKLDKKKKIIILLTAIVVLLIIGILLFFLLKPEKEKYSLAEVEPTLSTLEDGTYYIFGAPNNQSFEVETKKGFKYDVVDEENNEVKVTTTKKDDRVIINAPENLYEYGKTYTLKITNGTFIDEELKETTKITFSIVRKSAQSSQLKENVKIVSSKDNKIKETNDNITLISEEKYKTGDVILVDNERAYKVVNEENGTYQLSIPTIEEVYNKFDYYGSAYLNLSEFEENEELEDYLVAYAEENLIDKFIPSVYADSKIKVDCEWDKEINGLVATIHAETDPGDKLFNKSFLKHHKLSFDYEVVIKAKVNYDIFLNKYDVNFTLEITNQPGFSIKTESETLDKIKDGLKAYTAGENAIKLLNSDYNSIKRDTKNLKQTIGKVVTPTPVPGLNVVVDLGLIMEFDLKANMKATLTNTNTVTIGLNNKNGLYGKLNYKNKIDASALGEANMRLGAQVGAGFNLLGIIELTGGFKGGIYGEADLKMESNISKDKISAEVLATIKTGIFSSVVVEAEVFGIDKTATIYDGKLELYKFELPISSESDKSQPASKEETTTTPEENKDNSSDNKNENVTKPEENNNNNNSGSNDGSNNSQSTSRYTASEVKEKLLTAFNENYVSDRGCGGFYGIYECETINIDVNKNTLTLKFEFGTSDDWNSFVGYTCIYNYVNDALSCTGYDAASSRLRELCQNAYNNYQALIDQGEDPNEWGYYTGFTVNACFNDMMSVTSNQKSYYKNKINNLLSYAGLTINDLSVLK